ncbi:hypothetical protein CCACVL1_25069 [Corchorus capsularis]|uniref:Uncharacterized protein n=1 Tax=Corchorus capsularis TaxID=210143 RepID=A0A1R3GM02_COCAP|nr:hypothetical protein CCACVL1_25069 [Corchorus capsularis]
MAQFEPKFNLKTGPIKPDIRA